MASILKVNEIQHTGGTTALTIDSSGRLNKPAQPIFFANGSEAGYQAATTSNSKIAGWEGGGGLIILQGGLSYSSGTITVPIDGIYEVTGSILTETDNGEYMLLMIYKNGTRVSLSQQYNATSSGQIGNTTTTHAFVNCVANDTIELHQQGSTTSVRWYNNGSYGTFGVRLIG
jgi:hypothetical protein